MESIDILSRRVSMHLPYYVRMSNVGQSIHGIYRYFAKRGIYELAMLCIFKIGQSIHGIRRYFTKGYPLVQFGWPYYVATYVQCLLEYQ